MASFFDDFPQALSSKAFAAFCDTLYGHFLRLDDALIEEDVDALSAFASVARGGRILDSGCGSGDLLGYLCRLVDAEGTGIDPSPACFAAHSGSGGQSADDPGGQAADGSAAGSLLAKALARSREPSGLFVRASAVAGKEAPAAAEPASRVSPGEPGEIGAAETIRKGRLSFVRTTAQECRGVEGRFQLVLAVDSLAEGGDIATALDRLVDVLAPGGVLLIAHTERLAAKDPRLGFSSTSVAQALKRRGLDIRGRDLTRSEKLHWKLARRLLGKLAEDCAAEGRPAIAERLARMVEAMNESVERDDFRRYWYRVLAPGSAR